MSGQLRHLSSAGSPKPATARASKSGQLCHAVTQSRFRRALTRFKATAIFGNEKAIFGSAKWKVKVSRRLGKGLAVLTGMNRTSRA
jgi:hypothetical protein